AQPPAARVADAPGAWASATIAVGEQRIADLVLTLRPGVRVTGRVEFHGSAPPPPAARVTRAGIILRPEGPPVPAGVTGDPAGPFDESGAFSVTGVPPGRYVIDPSFGGATAIAPWTLESITIGARDVGDSSIVVGDHDITDVLVTFTDKPAQLTGTV